MLADVGNSAIVDTPADVGCFWYNQWYKIMFTMGMVFIVYKTVFKAT